LTLIVFIGYFSLVPEGGTKKIACVGDSITEGFGISVDKRKEFCWPSVLQKILGNKYKIENFGVCGRTLIRDVPSSWVKTNCPKRLSEFKPDIIIMMLGTNDSQKKVWKYKDNFEEDLKKYIADFRKINRSVKIYLSLPPPSFSGKKLRTGDNYSASLIRDEIIPILRKVAKEEKIPVIDTFSKFIKKPEYFADGLHPNIQGAEAIAKFIASELKLKK
jgi:lysophospholipase L1-like esterase